MCGKPTEVGIARTVDISARSFWVQLRKAKSEGSQITHLLNWRRYNCNFCALSGTFPDKWSPDKFPRLSQFFWDGNGFSGTLPASVGSLKTLTTLSFNINNFRGKFPVSFCNTAAPDCRIGADYGQAGLARYQAIYPWTLSMNATGNRFECGKKVPACITEGGNCNKTYKDPAKDSPVVCV